MKNIIAVLLMFVTLNVVSQDKIYTDNNRVAVDDIKIIEIDGCTVYYLNRKGKEKTRIAPAVMRDGEYIDLIKNPSGIIREDTADTKEETPKKENRQGYNFKWDVVTEMSGTKEQLYSRARMVIADLYNSATDVTKNADPELGIIQIKAKTTLGYSRNLGFAHINYYYGYSIKLMFKDGKYRLILNGVHADGTNDYRWPYPPVGEGFKVSLGKHSVTQKQYEEMMSDLKSHLRNLIMNVQYDMEKTDITYDDW